ncbi:MAG: biotin--[acetyl-CoA-carboxylase] ligase [Luteitalea sp.]|nr:biotin--[acetyl-CoA-carboxylase] ligase [Luteitalea sp.]
MTFRPDDLPTELAEALERARPRLGRLGHRLLFFSSVGSTNDVAAGLAATGDAEGAVVVADAQTAGRGRRGHTWFSPPGAGVYVSLVLAPAHARHSASRAVSLVTLMAGVALVEAVQQVTGLAADIKWPNDLLVGRRKLAGILAEGVARPAAGGYMSFVVLGYGLNVSPAAYPQEIDERVTCLETELGRRVDRPMLVAETIAVMAERYADLLACRFDAILDAWRDRSPGSRGARVSWESPSGIKSGVTDGIDDTGALLVRSGSRVERIVSGEIRWGA